MIYEKRSLRDGCGGNVQNEEMCEGIITARCDSTVTEYTAADIPVYEPMPPASRRKFKRMRRQLRGKSVKTHIPRKILLGLCTVLFCVFTLDNRLYGGKLLELVREYSNFAVQNADVPTFLKNIFSGKEENVQYLSMESPAENDRRIVPKTDDVKPTSDKDAETSDKAETVNNSQEESSVAVTGNMNGAVYSDGETYYPITTLDLSAGKVTDLTNGTVYSPDTEKIMNTYPSALENVNITDEPLVLIVHTHACESYTAYTDMYPEGESTRTQDTQKNVVRVGEELASTLENYGIGVIHCKTLCDKESFIDAYNVSHDEVQRYLEEFPSIKIVIDVHRDAIIRQNGESIRPVANIAGQDYAQLMFVVGTGQAAHSHPNWEQNLSLAMHIQSKAEKRYLGLFRPINLRSVPFNQWLSNGYLLLEVGSNSNTLDEAVLSAQAFGVTLSEVLKESGAAS